MNKILVILLLFLLISVTSCDYLSTITKNESEPSKTGKLEKYVYIQGRDIKVIELNTIKKWEGDKSTSITYRANKAPWILNAKFNVTSKLSSAYDLQLSQKTEIKGITLVIPVQKAGQEFMALVNDTGDFIIEIKASGVKWSVKIGIE